VIKIEVDLPAIEKVKSLCRRYPASLKEALSEGLLAIALEIQRAAVERLKSEKAIDLGALWNSIAVHRISPTEIIVGTNLEYAAAVEFGATGHWVTIDKIPGFQGWLRRHGIDVDGTMKYFYVQPKPRPYMEPAYQAGVKAAPREIREAVESVIARLGL
jgi:phage gpG-like protein